MRDLISSPKRVLLATWLIFGVVQVGVWASAADALPNGQHMEASAVKLDAASAQIIGPNAKLEGGDQKNIIWWTYRDTFLRWDASLPKQGEYVVEIDYSVIGNNNGSPLEITVGDQTLTAIPKAGANIGEYKRGLAGKISVEKAGVLPVVVKPSAGAHEFVLNLRSIDLVPADAATDVADIGGNPIQPSADSSIVLTAAEAAISGMNAQLTSGGDEKNIWFWKDRDTSLAWNAGIRTPGKYRVELNYALNRGMGACKLEIAVGEQVLRVGPKSGKDWTDYHLGTAGEITVDKPGAVRVIVRPLSLPYQTVCNLRAVVLRPADVPNRPVSIADPAIAPSSNGIVKLTAAEAQIDGTSCRLEGGEKKFIVWWNSPFSSMQWPVKIAKDGRYAIELTYSLSNTEPDSAVEVFVGDQKAAADLTPGSDLDNFKTVKIGEVRLDKADDLKVVLKSTKQPGSLVMHFDSISLAPLGEE